MIRNRLWLALTLVSTACGGAIQHDAATADETETTEESEPADQTTPAEPPAEEFLPTPYTAEQIRNEWVTGLVLTFRRGTPPEQSLQRWTVVAADAEGVTIEFAAVDTEGEVQGEPQANRSTWTELRDHARFLAANARREETRRATPLGELAGWLYTVENPDEGSVSLLFFAHDLPGAPVWVRTTRGDDVLDQLEQLERRRPE